ncbi:MAG: SprT family zinc-dependent metalloprotease [Legionella sp.]|nr:SprT family zinc-dependent metalloprotease [Legionella sp.]
MIIEIDGIPIEIIRKPIKGVNLRIYPDGFVKVSAPLKYSERLLKHYLIEKSPWIQKQRARLAVTHIPQEQKIETGASIPFKGKNYLLILEEQYGPSHIEIKEEIIYLFLPPQTSALRKEAILERWYRHEMNSIIPTLIDHWQKIIGVRTSQWGIKKMKTRWGSCNTRTHRIWLNLSLIKKHPKCLEYVLVHELVHLLEASHNQRFYALMNQFMPEWQEYQYLLEGKYLRK